MAEKNIILPEDLHERRRVLENELSATVTAIVEEGLEEDLKHMLNSVGFTEGTATVEWDYRSEYDDEGGYYQCIDDVWVAVNGESIDLEDEVFENDYDTYLPDYLHDILSDYRRDLAEQDITYITVRLH